MDFTDWLDNQSVLPAALAPLYINLAQILLKGGWSFTTSARIVGRLPSGSFSEAYFINGFYRMQFPDDKWQRKFKKSVCLTYIDNWAREPATSRYDYALTHYPIKRLQTAEDLEFACSEVKDKAFDRSTRSAATT
jgi:hypothetical protein